MGIVFALTSPIWCLISYRTAIAVSLDTAQSKGKLISASSSTRQEKIAHHPPLAIIHSDAGAWVTTQPTIVAPIKKRLLAEAPSNTHDGVGSQQSYSPNSIKDVNALSSIRHAESSDLMHLKATQLKLQPIEPLLPLTDSQSAQADNKLDKSQAKGDPELGVLRVRQLQLQSLEANSDSELGTLRLRDQDGQFPQANSNSELGTLRLREQEGQPPKLPVFPQVQPTVHLLAHVSYFKTNNVFSGVDPVDDSLISSGLTLWALPALGSKTDLSVAIDGNLFHYVERSQFSYNQLRFRTGIRQRLTPQIYGEIGWTYQQLFRASSGDRFLNENSIRLALRRRDRLTNKLQLDSVYDVRLSFAEPQSRSRIINSLSVSLSYYIRSSLQVGLDYQFSLSDFTQRDRQDEFHRLLSRLTYTVSRDSRISVQAGINLGGSSDPNIDIDGFFFTVNYSVELGEF